MLCANCVGPAPAVLVFTPDGVVDGFQSAGINECTDCDETFNGVSFDLELVHDPVHDTCYWQFDGNLYQCCKSGYTTTKPFYIKAFWQLDGGTYKLYVQVWILGCDYPYRYAKRGEFVWDTGSADPSACDFALQTMSNISTGTSLCDFLAATATIEAG